MKIRKIKIENFRLLKDFSIDLEDKLSLVIGKNNTGKTSLLLILNKFLKNSDRNTFLIDDFNLDFKKNLKEMVEVLTVEEEKYNPQGIKLKLFIEYNKEDDLSNISDVMMDLNPDNNFIVISFEYVITYEDLQKLKNDFNEYKKKSADGSLKELDYFLKQNYTKYFKIFKKSLEYNIETKTENELQFIDLDKEKIPLTDIINYKYISAKRDVANKEIDKTLSSQTSKIYKKSESSNENENAIEKFKDQIIATDSNLTLIYKDIFKEVINKVKMYGGIKQDDSIINIVSTLQHRELLDGNTTVMYDHNGYELPEHYNGLGYMNLISIIFEIEIIIKEFIKGKDEKPSNINLLFIEEPEAHTHPQMQYVFIKNIKALIDVGVMNVEGKSLELQCIISTHSSHIVSESDFDDIKYLKKETANSVISKNLKSLEQEYSGEKEQQHYRFLKQYLTLNRAELFFADKVILVEGDTERILLPAIMKKMDQENQINPLLSQYISIVEVGDYSQIYEKFINFIGTKTLIITDIDSYYEIDDGKGGICTKKCSASDPNVQYTSNSSLLFFHDKNKKEGIGYFINLQRDKKILTKINGKWINDKNGQLYVAYQTKEEDYYARSFEDAFFHINKVFIVDENNKFNSLTNKYIEEYKNSKIGVFDFADRAVGKKPSLAIEILINSKADSDKKEYSNWKIPHYIKEGLEWLREN